MEIWTYSPDLTLATVTGRTRVPLWKKFIPLWWFMNDTEQTVDQAAWYHPEWPYWRRWLTWNTIRNPMQNLRCFVIGVQDKNYPAKGGYPITCVQRDDIGELGLQWCVLEAGRGGDLWFSRPFVSYCSNRLTFPRPFTKLNGRRFVGYAGWQISGFFGIKATLAK